MNSDLFDTKGDAVKMALVELANAIESGKFPRKETEEKEH